MTLPRGFGRDTVEDTRLPTHIRESINSLSPEQFKELKGMIAENKSPFSTKVKNATTIHHSYRVIYILGMSIFIPMLGIIGWLSTETLWVSLAFMTAAGILGTIVGVAGKDTLDRWTNSEERNRNSGRNRNFY